MTSEASESPAEAEEIKRRRGGEEEEESPAKHFMTGLAGLVQSRVIRSHMTPREILTSKTIAAIFLGEGSQTEHCLFYLGVKNAFATGVLWALWFVGAFVGMLVVSTVLPLSCVWASVLMLPLPVVTILLLSEDLLWLIFKELDLYIILILQTALFVDGIFYCKQDMRYVFWCCYLPTMIAAGLIDAYPAKYRAFFAKLFFSAAVCILVFWNFLLVFRWRVFGAADQQLYNVSFTLHHLSDQATLLVFYCRHLYCSVYRKNYFVLIKADVHTVRTRLDIEAEVEEDGEEHDHYFLPAEETGHVEVKLSQHRRPSIDITASHHLGGWPAAGERDAASKNV